MQHIQFLRGNTAQNNLYIGPPGSLTIDIERGEVHLHDGVTPGGTVIGGNTASAQAILDALLSVDGEGSSLDADTLDGKHFSDIEALVQSRLNDLGLRDTQTTSADWVTNLNTIVGTRFFSFDSNAIGSPDHSNYTDFNGWQIDDAVQTVQFAVGSHWTAYMRVNDDGTWNDWHPLYTGANIIGTVRQGTNGALGGILEYGKNSNGEYLRFADGTQFCWATVTFDNTGSNSTSSRLSYTWTFPAAFVGGLPKATQMNVPIHGSVNFVDVDRTDILQWGGSGSNNDISHAFSIFFNTGTVNTSTGRVDNVALFASGRWMQ